MEPDDISSLSSGIFKYRRTSIYSQLMGLSKVPMQDPMIIFRKHLKLISTSTNGQVCY
ncbi:hypothetical protein LOAG_15743 [Loa loa]|uniref:Uncharacterized protein n=1 Tax=Loa loa TaxID=7209 RepID=A0A1S0TF38_LOALO|nr:hypothetical protein LOAG_15743 [Loa loa]EFO12790.2 hypothetical protein LOAG_15743 [Loa loa]